MAAAPDFNTDEVAIHAASLLKDSGHRLEQPVVAYARLYGIELLPVAHVEIVPDQGLLGRVNGKISVLGNQSLMTQVGIDIASMQEEAQAWRDTGKDVFFLSIGDHLAGLIAFSIEQQS